MLLRYRRIRVQAFYLYELGLAGRTPPKDHPSMNVSVKVCSEKDVRTMPIPRLKGIKEENVRRGNLALAAFSAGEIVACGMLSYQEILKDAAFKNRLDIAQFVDFDGAYIWGVYTSPSYRRKGIMKKVLWHMLRIAKKKGSSRVYAIIQKDNLASRRAFEAVQFIPTKTIYLLTSPILTLVWQTEFSKTAWQKPPSSR